MPFGTTSPLHSAWRTPGRRDRRRLGSFGPSSLSSGPFRATYTGITSDDHLTMLCLGKEPTKVNALSAFERARFVRIHSVSIRTSVRHTTGDVTDARRQNANRRSGGGDFIMSRCPRRLVNSDLYFTVDTIDASRDYRPSIVFATIPALALKTTFVGSWQEKRSQAW
jgi:hypothetical protein